MAPLALLCFIEIGLRVSTLPAVCSALRVPMGSRQTTSTGRSMSPREADRVWVAGVVSGWWPFGDTCLRRAVVQAVLLRRHQARLVIGVQRSEHGDVRAHAWVEVDGRSLDPLSEQYLSLA